MNQLDLDISKGIEYSQFLVTCCNKEKLLNESALKASFEMWDVEGKGSINLANIKNVLSSGNFGGIEEKESPLETILQGMGVSEDQEITYSQFKILLTRFIEDEKVMQSLTQA